MRPTLQSMEVRLQLDARELQAAAALTGIADPAELMPHVLREFLHTRVSAEVRALSGSDPEASAPPRRRPPDFMNPPPGQVPPGT